jgi:hypothetical protein
VERQDVPTPPRAFCMRLLSRLLPPSRRLLVTHSADRATIYALSTPPGQAGVAVVRVSGPAARDVFAAMVFNSKTSTPLRPRHSHLTPCIVLDHRPTSRATIDQAMAVFFQGKRLVWDAPYAHSIQVQNHSPPRTRSNCIYTLVSR